MDPLIPVLDSSREDVRLRHRSASSLLPGLERHRVTVVTAMVIVLAFAVSLHCPDATTVLHHYRGR